MTSPLPADSPYNESFERCYEIVNASVSKGYPLLPFGPAILGLIEAKELKKVYRIGKLTEKLSVLLNRLLPSQIFEKILTNHYRL